MTGGSPKSMAELTNRRIDHYNIEALIGQGGIASVYRAYDERFKRQVALKILNRREQDIELVRERFAQEGQIIAALEHHAIVPVYDFGEYDGRPFIVMRLMGGGSLQDRLEAGRLTLPKIAGIYERIASALDRAHDQGIIHRDIKPANILFDSDRVAFLADFGMARFSDLTLSGMIIGSPHYMSPEQAQGRPLDRRSDIYQLGVVLYELIAGRVPFDGESIEAVLYQHVHEAPPPIRPLAPDLPSEIEWLIEDVLAKDPLDRPVTAGELARRLRGHLPAELGETGSTPTAPLPTPSPPVETLQDRPAPAAWPAERPRALWGWIAGVLAVLAVAFILVGVWTSFGRETAGPATPGGAGLAAAGVPAQREGAAAGGLPDERAEPAATATARPAVDQAPLLPPLLLTPDEFRALTGAGGLLFAANPLGQFDLFAWGGQDRPRQLTTIEVDDFRPGISPSAAAIIYHSQRTNWEIFSMTGSGGSKRNLTNHPAQDTFPRWTPDGRILFQSNRRGGQFDLFLMDANGENLRPLTSGPVDETDAAAAPDGRIAFVAPVPVSERESVPQIFVMAADGSNPMQVTFDDRWGSFAPSWSPDGRHIAFYSTRTDGIPSLYLMEADGSSPILLTDFSDPSFYPVWSPNGQWIAFHRLMVSEGAEEEGGNRDLWLVSRDGSELIRLTETAGIQERMPDFTP